MTLSFWQLVEHDLDPRVRAFRLLAGLDEGSACVVLACIVCPRCGVLLRPWALVENGGGFFHGLDCTTPSAVALNVGLCIAVACRLLCNEPPGPLPAAFS